MMGFPTLSFTLMGAASRLRAFSGILLVLLKGLSQKNPLRVKVPSYLPKNITTRASLGSTLINPHNRISAARINTSPPTIPAASCTGSSAANDQAAAPHSKKNTNSIKKPDKAIPLNTLSLVSVSMFFTRLFVSNMILF